MKAAMTTLSPSEASILALIAEYKGSPDRLRELLGLTKGAKTRRIAQIIVSNRQSKTGSESDRQAARSIRRWADTNKKTKTRAAAC